MPTYEYEPVDPESCPRKGCRFEVVQAMSEPALNVCPECGAAVERVLSACSIHGVSASQSTLSNKSLAEKGFTKYVKAGDGHYEKVAGQGPNVIQK